MATQVRVTSIDALERFRASLIVFLAKARRSMDEVSDEVRRTRVWLQSDQRTHWETQLRRRRKVQEQAEQELFSAKLSGLRETTAAQQAAVHRARKAVAEAEDKLRMVKSWNSRYDACAEPLTKSLEGLRYFLDYDLPKGIAFLANAQRTLDAYAESAAPVTPSAPQPETPMNPAPTPEPPVQPASQAEAAGDNPSPVSP